MTPWRLLALTIITLSVSTGTAGAQDAGTVLATVRVQPLDVELSVPETPFSTGEIQSVKATVHNLGQARLEDITVELRHPDHSLRVHRPVRRLPHLPGTQARTMDWRLCATQEGVFGVIVRVEARSEGGPVVAESATRLLYVEGEGRRSCR